MSIKYTNLSDIQSKLSFTTALTKPRFNSHTNSVFSHSRKDPFTHAIFCRTFQCNFCRARARDKKCKCKLAAISVRFVAAISQRFRTCSKLDVTWRRFGGNCSKYRTLNRREIAASLHLRQKLHWRARQKLHQKSHV